MNKSLLILKREYLTRVKKKSFIIMTLLVPFMMVLFTVLPIYLSTMDDEQQRTIAVYDETSLFLNRMEETQYTRFHYIPEDEYNALKADFKSGNYYAVLHIPINILSVNQASLISDKQVTIDIKNLIENRLNKLIENDKRQQIIAESGIPDLDKRLSATRTNINLSTIKLGEEGKAIKGSTEMAMAVGYISGFLIYMFVLMYGMMVMRGVMEEKSSRIVEVIISSVKPFQLMFGKIVGIGLVGLTQVAIWVVLGFSISTGIHVFFGGAGAGSAARAQSIVSPEVMNQAGTQVASNNQVLQVLDAIGNLNLFLIISCFIFYFVAGFILYASLMGSIGAATDNDEDAQQMMFPVMFPLIFSITILFPVIKNPEGAFAFWTSIFPLTSPIIMMVRIPFGVAWWELVVSIVTLLATILGTIWIAGKIYRTGILMYGKKVNLKEIIKWLRYKN